VQKCAVLGSPLEGVLSPKAINICSWCSSHDFMDRLSPCSSWSWPKMVSDQEYRKVHNNMKHSLAFIEKKVFYDNYFYIIIIIYFFSMIIRGISRQCLIYGLKLDRGNFIL
jgi:disulfide oxidoreductase YuzD